VPIKDVLCDGLASGRIAHELPGLMHGLGHENVTTTPQTLVLTSLSAAELMLELSRLADRAHAVGAISEAEHAGWIADLRARDESGRFFLALTGFVTMARTSHPGSDALAP
jgi:hypothetical protein